MDIFPNTTRIDFERQGDHVLAQLWEKGWIEGQWTDQCQYLVDTRIEAVLHQCELAGFTVEMMDSAHGRALRGETTRIDILHIETGWKIDKYPYGWTAKTRPISSRITDDAEAARAVAWLRANGWTIRNWPNGYRAWKGEAKPVRDTRTIQYMRRQIQANSAVGRVDQRKHFDLAFDF